MRDHVRPQGPRFRVSVKTSTLTMHTAAPPGTYEAEATTWCGWAWGPTPLARPVDGPVRAELDGA